MNIPSWIRLPLIAAYKSGFLDEYLGELQKYSSEAILKTNGMVTELAGVWEMHVANGKSKEKSLPEFLQAYVPGTLMAAADEMPPDVARMVVSTVSLLMLFSGGADAFIKSLLTGKGDHATVSQVEARTGEFVAVMKDEVGCIVVRAKDMIAADIALAKEWSLANSNARSQATG